MSLSGSGGNCENDRHLNAHALGRWGVRLILSSRSLFVRRRASELLLSIWPSLLTVVSESLYCYILCHHFCVRYFEGRLYSQLSNSKRTISANQKRLN